MKILWTIHFLLLSIVIIFLNGCIPNAAVSKAVCQPTQIFNNVSRSCETVVSARGKPVGTLLTTNFQQETAKTITLTYSDANNDKAISCRVNNLSANIEAVSPQVISKAIFTLATSVYNTSTFLAASIPSGIDGTNAALNIAKMQSSLAIAKLTFDYTNLLNQLGIFTTALNNLLVLSAPYTVNPVIVPEVQFYYGEVQNLKVSFLASKNFVDNRCDCTGGVCSTVIAPRFLQYGPAGFSYTITDIDGEGDPAIVNISISKAAGTADYLLPAAESSYVTFSESNTSTVSAQAFILPAARDYFGSVNFSYKWIGSLGLGKTAKGRVSDCMDLPGSTGPTDTTCTYTPDSGDTNDSIIPQKASALIGNLTYTAKAEGISGNSISIQYFNLANNMLGVDSLVSDEEKFGLISQSYPDAFVRVLGDSIKVFFSKGITTSADIQNLINSDPKAKSLVVASGGDALTLPDPAVLTASAKSLAGGRDAFESFAFGVSNNFGTSTNTSRVMIHMAPTEDAPVWNFLLSASGSGLEDGGPIEINFKSPVNTYSDVENNIDSCEIHTTGLDSSVDPLVEFAFLANFVVNSCSCDLATQVCKASVTPNAYVSSINPYNFYYRLKSQGVYTSTYKTAKVTVTPVNNAPSIVVGAVNPITENSTASAHSGFVDVTVSPGGGGFESNQILSMTVSTTSTPNTLIPSTSCVGYTPGSGSPFGVVTPTTSGSDFYFDMTNKVCYVSNGLTNASWELYPSVTAIPVCAYESAKPRAPTSVDIPSAAGKYFLDTLHNKCYLSTGTSASSWVADNTLSHFIISIIPAKNKSGTANITLSLKDDGGTSPGVDTTVKTFTQTVTYVDDPPFLVSGITKVDTNEGGMVIAGPFFVNEDEGNTADEDYDVVTGAHAMRISSITSDNHSVLFDPSLPRTSSSIRIFYDANNNGVEDSGEERNVGDVLETSGDVALHAFYLKLYPTASVSGNANVTLKFNDDAGADLTHTISTNFSLIVHPVAAIHGGWTNISAVGIKTDKSGAPANDSDVQCNYNKATTVIGSLACNNQKDCTGGQSPNAEVIPDGAGVIYFDSANKRCYRSTGSDKFSWVDFKTTCPVIKTAGLCSGENCIKAYSPLGNISPTASGQYFYDSTSNGTCYISTGTNNTDWTPYIPAKVTLSWNSFTVNGSGSDAGVGISGWNVYRREAGFDYDYKTGFLKSRATPTAIATITDKLIRTYTDTTAIAGKVYYYLVRPVDDTSRKLTISTTEIFSEVRVLAPTANLTFVHRWMVNQEICNSMHMTIADGKIDQTHNYRCPYTGPAETIINGVHYYDIGKDMLVDISENGCPYTSAPSCSSVTGCIGIGAPSSDLSGMSINDIYYDRSSGTCYLYGGGTTWTSFNDASLTSSIVSKANTALNAPLVNVTQTKANTICATRNIASATASLTGTTPPATTASLPSKKEYIAYAAPPINTSDSVITTIEQGYSLDAQSGCNSSNASGISAAFTDSSIPSTSYLYSIPGSASSGIRSIYTGSVPWVSNKSTEACTSRYGVQDPYGNVAEWLSDKMTCNGAPSTYVCNANSGTDLYTYDFGGGRHYAFDLNIGPYNDTSGNSDTTGADAFLTNWDFRETLYNAGKFSFPIGMPFNVDISNSLTVGSSPAIAYLLDIGKSAGITLTQLHEDGIIVNGAAVFADATQMGAFAQGGSYLSGNRSGRFTSELVPDSNSTRPDIGFRCYVPIINDNYKVDTNRHNYSY